MFQTTNQKRIGINHHYIPIIRPSFLLLEFRCFVAWISSYATRLAHAYPLEIQQFATENHILLVW